MDTQKYKILIKTIENGNLTKTAEQTGYTQSAITHMVNLLEKSWGVKVLDRSRSGTTVTSAGKKLLPLIRNVCNAELKLDEEVNSIKNLEKGLIRIGAFKSVSINILPDVITRFTQHYPEVEIEIHEGDYIEVENWLREGSIDIGFMLEPVDKKFESIHILNDNALILMPKGHPFTKLKKIPLEKLQDEPLIVFEEGVDDNFERHLKQHAVLPKKLYKVRDDYTIMAMVDAGLGVSILNKLVLTNAPFDIETRSMTPSLGRNIAIAYNKEMKPSPIAEMFIDYMLSK